MKAVRKFWKGATILMAAIAIGVAGWPWACVAQDVETPATTIQSEGKASVDVAPDFVVFWLHKRVEGASLAEAMTQALGIEPQLKKELETRELTTADLKVEPPVIPHAQENRVIVSARLRFSTTPFADTQEGPRQFAQLCDTINAIATALGLSSTDTWDGAYGRALDGPLFEVDDTQSAERAAIATAVENAYPAAEAVAQTMRARIIAVQNVSVQRVVWGEEPSFRAPQPSLARQICTARVTVTYLFSTTE